MVQNFPPNLRSLLVPLWTEKHLKAALKNTEGYVSFLKDACKRNSLENVTIRIDHMLQERYIKDLETLFKDVYYSFDDLIVAADGSDILRNKSIYMVVGSTRLNVSTHVSSSSIRIHEKYNFSTSQFSSVVMHINAYDIMTKDLEKSGFAVAPYEYILGRGVKNMYVYGEAKNPLCFEGGMKTCYFLESYNSLYETLSLEFDPKEWENQVDPEKSYNVAYEKYDEFEDEYGGCCYSGKYYTRRDVYDARKYKAPDFSSDEHERKSQDIPEILIEKND